MASSNINPTTPLAADTGLELEGHDDIPFTMSSAMSDYIATLPEDIRDEVTAVFASRKRAEALAYRFEAWADAGTLTPPDLKYKTCRSAAMLFLDASEENDETIAKTRSILEEIEAEPRKAHFWAYSFFIQSMNDEEAAEVIEFSAKSIRERDEAIAREAKEEKGEDEEVVEGGAEASEK